MPRPLRPRDHQCGHGVVVAQHLVLLPFVITSVVIGRRCEASCPATWVMVSIFHRFEVFLTCLGPPSHGLFGDGLDDF